MRNSLVLEMKEMGKKRVSAPYPGSKRQEGLWHVR